MDVLHRLRGAIVVPVVVLENAEDAVPTAKALLAGGVDVMEITFRTAAAPDAIKAVAASCPEMLVGAGTVISLEQCQKAVEMGARFIVSPGFDPEVVAWCMEHNVAVTPGCVTPTEIMAARKLGVKVIKFFPANVYGGLSAMKALAAPFVGIQFIPTGGVNAQNIGQYIAAPFVHTVGGSWVCPKKDIAEGNFEKITSLCREARQSALDMEITCVGNASGDICNRLSKALGCPVTEGIGTNEEGYVEVRTNAPDITAEVLARLGYAVVAETAAYKGGRLCAVHLKEESSGATLHLLQK